MQVLFRPGDAPDELYIIESGSVLCHIDYSLMSPVSRRLAASAEKDDPAAKAQGRFASPGLQKSSALLHPCLPVLPRNADTL